MIAFKCKICGGNLEIEQGERISTCSSCGSTHSLPNLNNDKVKNLYERANQLRRDHAFDKAMGMYETILTEQPDDPEVYWSLVLCRYGVEYVEDPKTKQRVITTHRTLPQSVQVDSDYKKAIQLASSETKRLYQQEAKAIDEIQKGILAISNQETPYDVFICYKETDDKGKRTIDSVLGQQLYDELTNFGYKVFFARITLESTLGRAYEPYIYSALTTAKVMLVLGTKKEYFESPWVRNEWGRYLVMMNTDKKKTLIPMYRDMDAFELPEEFRVFQAQDFNKIGAAQDVIRGIKKLIPSKIESLDEKIPLRNPPEQEKRVDGLLKRAFLFVEDEEWDSAQEYLNRILDQNPNDSNAYLLKVCTKYKVSNYEKLFTTLDLNNLLQDKEYLRAKRFADKTLFDYLTKEEDKVRQILKEKEAKELERIFTEKVNAEIKNLEYYGNEDEQTCDKVLSYLNMLNSEKYLLIEEKIRFYEDLKKTRKQARLVKIENEKAKTYDVINALIKKPTFHNYKKAEELTSLIMDFKDVNSIREFVIKEKIKLEKIHKANLKKSIIFASVSGTVLSVLLGFVYSITLATYQLNFNTNGGDTLNSTNIKVNERIDENLPLPTRTGHTFNNWYLDEELTQSVTNIKMPPRNITLHASWTINDYKIYISYVSPSPSEIGNFDNIFSGYNHTFSLISHNGGYNLFGWGNNSSGQLGDGTTIDKLSPTFIEINGLQIGEKIKHISTSNYHTVALTNKGRVYSWGLNSNGQLGDGTIVNKLIPSIIDFNGLQNEEFIEHITTGSNHSIALSSHGKVFAWGLNNYGQLGDGTIENRTTPTFIPITGLLNDEKIKKIESGFNHSIALTTNGRVFAWGLNSNGQLGDGSKTNRRIPTLIAFANFNDETIEQITAGSYHSFAITTRGRVYSWGSNLNGQLGDGTSTTRSTPTIITFNGIQFSETIQQITTGSYHSFALTSYGKVYAWGLNGNGELGDGTRSNRLTPTQITFNALSVGEKIENISAGNRHTHSITSFGRVLAWGLNSNGQLGDGTTSNTLIPITIENILVNLFILLENYISTTYNQTISLANPTLEGYTFIGWYMDQTLIVPLNLTIMPAYDLILYAKFIPT